jgi:hypothetical protein
MVTAMATEGTPPFEERRVEDERLKARRIKS